MLLDRKKQIYKEDEIRLIAYSIWEEEGCQDGHDSEHWLRAEAVRGKNRSKDLLLRVSI